MWKDMYCLGKFGKTYKEYIAYRWGKSCTPLERKRYIGELNLEIKEMMQYAKEVK